MTASPSPPQPDPATGALAATTVGDVMHHGVMTCARDAPAREVARQMAQRRVHAVAVTGHAQDGSGRARVWGIVSDLDLLGAVATRGAAPTAGELAHEPVITVRPTMPLAEVAQTMVRRGVHHVVVVDPDAHAPVGLVSTLDIVAVLAGGG